MSKKKKVKSSGTQKSSSIFQSRIFWAIILVLILIIAFAAGTNLYLFYNYALGNDVIVELRSSHNDLFLDHGESQLITFENQVVANPFCEVTCDYEFIDLSKAKVIDSGSFDIRNYASQIKEYVVSSPSFGVGQNIYRYDVQCKGVISSLCYTSLDTTQKNSIVTVNYDLTSEQKNVRSNLESDFISFTERLTLVSDNLVLLGSFIDSNDHIDFSSESNLLRQLQIEVLSTNDSLVLFRSLWEEQNLDLLSNSLIGVSEDISVIEQNTSLLLESVVSSIDSYNMLVFRISEVDSFLTSVNGTPVNSESFVLLNLLISDFMLYLDSFYNVSLISSKTKSFDEVYLNYTSLNNQKNTFNVGNTFELFDYSENITLPSNLSFDVKTYVIIERLSEINGICCVSGFCQPCCDSSCQIDDSLYPVVFLHGHDFSESVSPEFNLNIFSSMQRILEENASVYNFGSFVINDPNQIDFGLWGRSKSQISLRSSYYFETVLSEEDVSIFQAKKDNLDTYAIRLHDLISTITRKTGRDKVVLVSHSMGGLVTRRYMQIFGDSHLDKIIFIGTPHEGTRSNIQRYCGFFGSEAECRDMKEGSLFLQKLALAPTPTVETHNIIGVGCETGLDTGDGIVENGSAYLPWATNYYINGSCDEFSFMYLHNEFLDPNQYPEVTSLVIDLVSS